jgi:hypothetical protein
MQCPFSVIALLCTVITTNSENRSSRKGHVECYLRIRNVKLTIFSSIKFLSIASFGSRLKGIKVAALTAATFSLSLAQKTSN